MAERRAALGLTDADPSIEQLRRAAPALPANAPDEDFVAAYKDKSRQAAAAPARQAPREGEAPAPDPRQAVQCAENKSMGFPVGEFSGDRTREEPYLDGRCKASSWVSLHLTASENGCLSWRAMSRAMVDCGTGTASPTSCVERGDASVGKTFRQFVLTTAVTSKASVAAANRYRIWQCGKSRVRSDMAANLGPRCTLVGSDADVTEERVGDAACRSTNLFDGGGLVTVIGPDNLQVKLASGETLTLVRSAPRD